VLVHLKASDSSAGGVATIVDRADHARLCAIWAGKSQASHRIQRWAFCVASARGKLPGSDSTGTCWSRAKMRSSNSPSSKRGSSSKREALDRHVQSCGEVRLGTHAGSSCGEVRSCLERWFYGAFHKKSARNPQARLLAPQAAFAAGWVGDEDIRG